jgi:20S proteasome subunit alpha 6
LAGRMHGRGPAQGGNRRGGNHGGRKIKYLYLVLNSPSGHFSRRHGGSPNKADDDSRTIGDRDPHGRRDENRRSLTDFKIIGWCIPQFDWSWGKCKEDQIKSEDPHSSKHEIHGDAQEPAQEALPAAPRSKLPHEPPSRLRFYFHAPPEEISRPSLSETIATRGKRKKVDDDDDDDGEHRERNIRQRQLSEAPSVEMEGDDRLLLSGEKVQNTETDEGDWLMAAIGEGSDAATPISRSDMDTAGEFVDNLVAVSESGDGAPAHEDTPGNVPLDDHAVLVSPPKEETDEEKLVGGTVFDDNELQGGVDASHDPLVIASSKAGYGHGISGNPSEPSEESAMVGHQPALVPLNLDVQPDALIDGDNQIVTSNLDDATSVGIIQELLQGDNGARATHSPAVSAHSHSSTLFGSSAEVMTPTIPLKEEMLPDTHEEEREEAVSPNRLSILYAGSQKRLIVNAECVEAVKLFRRDGRFEILLKLERHGDGYKGISVC